MQGRGDSVGLSGVQTSPELARLLNEDLEQDESMVFPGAMASSRQGTRQMSTKGGSPRAVRSPAHMMDTPRMYEDEIPEDEEIAMEMDEVKKERAVLMMSIAHVKQDAGMAGGEAQQADINQLVKVCQGLGRWL